MTHENSVLSFGEMKAKGSLDKWNAAVLATYKREARPLTDREVIVLLKATDFNQVRPEITRLIQRRVLQEETYKVKCPYTKRTVRVCTIR